MDIRPQVRQIVTSLLTRRGDSAPFRDSDSLVLSGRLESISVVELAGFLEEQFSMDFARMGFDPMDFDSVESIVAAVTRQGERSGSARAS